MLQGQALGAIPSSSPADVASSSIEKQNIVTTVGDRVCWIIRFIVSSFPSCEETLEHTVPIVV